MQEPGLTCQFISATNNTPEHTLLRSRRVITKLLQRTLLYQSILMSWGFPRASSTINHHEWVTSTTIGWELSHPQFQLEVYGSFPVHCTRCSIYSEVAACHLAGMTQVAVQWWHLNSQLGEHAKNRDQKRWFLQLLQNIMGVINAPLHSFDHSKLMWNIEKHCDGKHTFADRIQNVL